MKHEEICRILVEYQDRFAISKDFKRILSVLPWILEGSFSSFD